MVTQEKVREIVYETPDNIIDNPYQPRRGYSLSKVDEIASSIEANGLLEVPMGRRKGDKIELAFGHVRKRAYAKLHKKNAKQWPAMPVEIRDLTDEQMAIYALEENLKRSDITPVNVARSVTKYMELFPETKEIDIAGKLSMTQGNISNMRRVMRLPEKILEKIDAGRISFTMARELCIFEGLTAAGEDSHFDRKEGKQVNTPKDSEWLMLNTVKDIETPGTIGRYGMCSPTVEGMQKAIH